VRAALAILAALSYKRGDKHQGLPHQFIDPLSLRGKLSIRVSLTLIHANSAVARKGI
jgi:hypothetical protein